MLVAEARRVLLGTLQRLGTALPDQDAQAPDKAAADRLRELREWCASALCRLRSGFLVIPAALSTPARLTARGKLTWLGHQLASLSDLRDPPSEGCPCRDLRVTVP